MSNVSIPLNEKRLLSIPEFQAYASIGRNNAFKLIRKAGCEIRIGRRVFADRVVFDAWCEANVN